MKLMISGVTFSAAIVRSPSFSRSSSSTTTRIRPARISAIASGTDTKGIVHCICCRKYPTPGAPYVKMGFPRREPPTESMPRLLTSLPELTLTGIVDILMVVRGTRAWHILIGILILVLLYAIALWTGLEALRSVLAFIVPYLGLAVIVMFQSEIRRTLARLGRKRWWGFGGGFRGPESASEILLAVEQLAAQKTGALIVLERDIGLRTFIERGEIG